MAKKSVFITRSDFSPVLYELLRKKFELVCWNECARLPKDKLMENVKGKFGIVCCAFDLIDEEVIEAAGDWRNDEFTLTSLLGPGLYKSTMAVVGCGRIGLSILKKLKSFDPKNLLYYSRSRKPEADELGADLQPIDFIMKESDFIIVALDQNVQTKGIINKNRINSMKPTAILINVGRGGLLDEDALIEALQNKKIAGAGLDVFSQEPLPVDSPLAKLDNVVLSPHSAYKTYDCFTSMSALTALNMLAVLNGTEMPAEVL